MSDGDDAALRERVDTLETALEQQQETLQKMLPGRRSVLAGMAGVSAGALGMRSATDSASAQAAGQVGSSGNPMDANLYDVDIRNGADAHGNDISNVGSMDATAVNADEAEFGMAWSFHQPSKPAKLVANDDITLHVSPSGDDSNDGSLSSPVATPNEAMSRVPKYLLGSRSVNIYLDYGDYTPYSGPTIVGHTFDSSESYIRVYGHSTENPFYDSGKSVADVRVIGGLVAGNIGYDGAGILFDSVTIDGRTQVFESSLIIRDSVITTGSGGNNAGISGYAFRVVANRCTFEDLGEGVSARHGSRIALLDCDGSNISGAPFRLTRGSFAGLQNSTALLNGAAADPQLDETCWVVGEDWPSINTAGGMNVSEVEYTEKTGKHWGNNAAIGSGDNYATNDVTGVSTTATEIFNLGNIGDAFGTAELAVSGSDSSNNRFLDKVLFHSFSGDTSVIASVTRGSPATRTYSEGNTGVVQLAMGSDTYNVHVAATQFTQVSRS